MSCAVNRSHLVSSTRLQAAMSREHIRFTFKIPRPHASSIAIRPQPGVVGRCVSRTVSSWNSSIIVTILKHVSSFNPFSLLGQLVLVKAGQSAVSGSLSPITPQEVDVLISGKVDIYVTDNAESIASGDSWGFPNATFAVHGTDVTSVADALLVRATPTPCAFVESSPINRSYSSGNFNRFTIHSYIIYI